MTYYRRENFLGILSHANIEASRSVFHTGYRQFSSAANPIQKLHISADVEDSSQRWNNQKSIDKRSSDLITHRRIPPNFVKEVLIPHLESWIYKSRKVTSPFLVELVIAYSQMPVYNKHIVKALADMVILRLVDFNGAELAKVLFPLFRLRPEDAVLFAHLSVELEEHFFELTTLNLITVVRVYARMHKNKQQRNFLEELVIPRLQTDISQYDSDELNALLMSLSAVTHMATAADVPLLAAIVPQIERRYDETPLLTSILNLNALCRVRVYHKRLLELLSNDLSNRYRIRNLPPKYIAMAVWTFARYGVLNKIIEAFEELIELNLQQFTSREFARFCQALPDQSSVPLKIALTILETLPNAARSDFPFFFLGCARRGYFPTESGVEPIVTFDSENDGTPRDNSFLNLDAKSTELMLSADIEAKAARNAEGESDAIPRETILHECLQYVQTFEEDFSAEDIMRLARILRNSYNFQYGYISKLFPKSWESILNEVMFMAK